MEQSPNPGRFNHALAAASVAGAPNCTTKTVDGTVHLATIKASGVSWAIAGLAIASGCGYVGYLHTTPPPPVGVFERQPHGNWTFNSEAGKPFPCPFNPGSPVGQGSSNIPPEVLQAWQIPYYTPNCLTFVPSSGH